MLHKNFKNIDRVTYGRGSFAQLGETIAPIRQENQGYFVFIVDNYFNGKPLANRLQNQPEDWFTLLMSTHTNPPLNKLISCAMKFLRKKVCLRA